MTGHLHNGGRGEGGFTEHRSFVRETGRLGDKSTFRDISGDGKDGYVVIYAGGSVGRSLGRTATRPRRAVRSISWPGCPRPQNAPQALGATLLRPLMTRSMASPPRGSVRLASILRVKRINSGWERPRSVASFMTFGLPISFTKTRPRL